MTGPGKLRLFLAVALPAEQLEWLDARCRSLAEIWPEARWTSPGGRHITLKFLGATAPDLVARIEALGSSVARRHDPSSLQLDGVGVFPSPRRARVLWVGVDDPLGLLGALVAELDEGLAELGYEPEKRPFSAHVTLARFRAPARIEALPDLPPAPAPFEVGSFGLWRSRLSPKGATYEPVAGFPLRSGSVA